MSLVYATKMHCKLCDDEVVVHLYSDDFDFKMTPEKHKMLFEHVDYSHWCHHHRICAICGEVVNGKDLDLLVAQDYHGQINRKYIEWLKYPDHGLLTIHKKCLEQNG